MLDILNNFPFKRISFDSLSAPAAKEIFTPYCPPNCKLACGATKLVIIPNNKNYVIKIPFSMSEFDTPFEGAPFSSDTWDYCSSEVSLYHYAATYGIQSFLARTRFVMNIGEYRIYVQKKCDFSFRNVYFRTYNRYSNEERRSLENIIRSSNIKLTPISLDFLLEIAKEENNNSVLNLLTFFENYDLNDFHASNYGYSQAKPMFFDYSGFYDQWRTAKKGKLIWIWQSQDIQFM